MATKKSNQFITKNIFILTISILTAVFTLSTVVMGVYLSRKIDDRASRHQTHLLVSSAIQNISRPTYKDTGGKQYIPEAKLMFEANHENELRYMYDAGDVEQGFKKHIIITTDSIITHSLNEMIVHENIEKLFEMVPKIQACSNLILITYDKNLDDYFGNYTFISEVDTGNEMIYIHSNTDELCNTIALDSYILNRVIQTVETARAY